MNLLINKLVLVVFCFILVLLFANCQKRSNIYEIDGYFEAYFPAQPTLYNSMENEISSTTIYNYFDENENLLYVGSYSILHYTPANPKGTLHSFILGLNENGEILKKEFGEHEGNDEILYVMKSERDYRTIYEYGIAVIQESTIYIWAIDESEDMVKSDRVYGENVKYFKVLK